MRILTSLLAALVITLWSTAAFAQYASLEGDPRIGPWLGVGGIYFNGDNNAVPADSDSEFLPTINLAGVSEYIAWQVFYAFGDDTSAFGGNVDFILADNFDECETCPDGGIWWFGIGPSIADVSDMYYDAANPTFAVDDTLFGGNLGFGYAWDMWAFQFYGHYFSEDQIAIQAMLLYSLGGN